MRRRIASILAVAATAGLLTACATPTGRFDWGNYESALYTYAKKPETRADYKAALQNAVERGRASNKVAPGLLAELGYLYMEDGDTAHAVALFEEEMTLFPESRAFLSGIVARAKGASPTAEQAKSEPTS